MSDYRIAVLGAAGRMGRELVRAVQSTQGCVLAGGADAPQCNAIGSDLGTLAGLEPLGLALTGDPLELIGRSDALIDFTSPQATVAFAAKAANAGLVHVIGTTGFSENDEAAIAAAAKAATIIKAGNMSLGVNLLTAITQKVAEALDADYDIEIVEMHHNKKVDAPSGTALMLGAAAARGRNADLKSVSVHTRDGQTGPRKRGDIGFATLRGGTVVGEHTVIFAGEGERIEVTHKAADRSIFAHGAIKAALWGRGKGPGLFAMTDVLGL